MEMQKLHLFVVKSGKPEPDIRRVIDSFSNSNLTLVWEYVENDYAVINKSQKMCPWYGIIYDNERADKRFISGLPQFLEMSDCDVLGVWSRTENDIEAESPSRSPRFYRKHVEIQKNSLMPSKGERIMSMLDGWIVKDD